MLKLKNFLFFAIALVAYSSEISAMELEDLGKPYVHIWFPTKSEISAMEPEDLGQTYVHIWLPTKGAYGHVAVHTAKYHMSLWPDGDAKSNANLRGVKTYCKGTEAALHLHPMKDVIHEDGRKPIQIPIPNCDTAKVNAKFEEVLKYNGINPKDAEYEIIDADKNRNPSLSISKTKWSQTGYQRFVGEHAFREPDFYKHEHSCTTFAAGLLTACGIFFPPAQEFNKTISDLSGYNFRDSRFLEVPEFHKAVDTIIARENEENILKPNNPKVLIQNVARGGAIGGAMGITFISLIDHFAQPQEKIGVSDEIEK